MSVALSYLAAVVPGWFLISEISSKRILGLAEIGLNAAGNGIRADLVLHGAGLDVDVSEQIPGTIFPAACPERHINQGGTFCLGLNAGNNITDNDSATVWWGLLHRYLELQRVAARTRTWPPRQALAHGAAGYHHNTALREAQNLGVVETYYEVLEGERRWISELKLRPNSLLLINGRAPCPVGCLYKSGHPRLRRDCQRKEAVGRLIQAEADRRKLETEFIESWRSAGPACCGQMERCELAPK